MNTLTPNARTTRKGTLNPQQLAGYLAGAVGTAAMLGSPQAQAAVIYWNPNDEVAMQGQWFSFNMVSGVVTPYGAAGGAGFQIVHSAADNVYLNKANLDGPAVGAGFAMSNLGSGTSIGSGSIFNNSVRSYFDRNNAGGYSWNTNANGTTGYVGLQFDISSQTHYGWARVTYNDGSNNIALHDFAYESVAGQSINAGDTGAVPEPSRTLLALAGLGGVALRRRRKQAA